MAKCLSVSCRRGAAMENNSSDGSARNIYTYLRDIVRLLFEHLHVGLRKSQFLKDW